MKKEYKRPSARKIDYCYDEQVVAGSEVPGTEQKQNDNYCHYKLNSGSCQSVVHRETTLCDTNLWSLR